MSNNLLNLNYLSQGVGIFFGVLSGAAINLIVNKISEKNREKETIKYFKFEIDLNISKIDTWLESLNDYRNAINSDTLDTYSGYFDLSRVATSFYNNTFYSGLLYKYLNFEDVSHLQVIYTEFSLSWENLLNTQTANNIKSFKEKKDYRKTEITQQINFWTKKFKDHKKTLNEIKQRFNKR